ncbi:MAG: folP [Microbacteriaceae bacterium]|jgi:dihydropteroate synthase|nr:folP [Microbacteriaceae bacterium]
MILGILNVTPDSFSDGGTHLNTASAIEFATRLHESGADIVDVGGESTRPGAERLPVEEEQRRVLPVIEELAKRGVPLSVDTMNARTAAAAAALGVGIINDVSGGTADPDMPKTIADSGVMFIAMHSRGSSATMDSRAIYRDTVRDVRTELERCVANLIGQGVRADRIIVDPGIGFAKNAGQNWELLAGLRELRALGHPVLVGASRKRFLADLLPVDSHPGDRDAATAVISALAAEAGVWGVRVHDVDSTKAALDVWSAMNGARK